jgi:hypothetical protein
LHLLLLLGNERGFDFRVGGGVAQAYATMGFTTFMKTVEVTRSKAGPGAQLSTIAVAKQIYKKEGIAGINKGVNGKIIFN